jgi:hypothetical protein
MPKYKVHVCRISYGHIEVETEANDTVQAYSKVREVAGDLDYSESHSEYKIQEVREIV